VLILASRPSRYTPVYTDTSRYPSTPILSRLDTSLSISLARSLKIPYSDRTRRNPRGQSQAIRPRIRRKATEILGRTLRPRQTMVAPIGNRTTDRTLTDRPAASGYTRTTTDPGSGGWIGRDIESQATTNPPALVGRSHPRRVHHGRHRQATTSRTKCIIC
jgi:hypothetical protein